MYCSGIVHLVLVVGRLDKGAPRVLAIDSTSGADSMGHSGSGRTTDVTSDAGQFIPLILITGVEREETRT